MLIPLHKPTRSELNKIGVNTIALASAAYLIAVLGFLSASTCTTLVFTIFIVKFANAIGISIREHGFRGVIATMLLGFATLMLILFTRFIYLILFT